MTPILIQLGMTMRRLHLNVTSMLENAQRGKICTELRLSSQLGMWPIELNRIFGRPSTWVVAVETKEDTWTIGH